MEAEGLFLWKYIQILGVGIVAIGCLFLCFGSMILVGGSFVAFKFIEDVMKNMETMPGLFVEKSEKDEIDP